MPACLVLGLCPPRAWSLPSSFCLTWVSALILVPGLCPPPLPGLGLFPPLAWSLPSLCLVWVCAHHLGHINLTLGDLSSLWGSQLWLWVRVGEVLQLGQGVDIALLCSLAGAYSPPTTGPRQVPLPPLRLHLPGQDAAS